MFTDESFEKKAESPARMSQEDLLEFFNSLKPKEEVLIWYDSGIRRADDWTPMTVGRRSESKKYNLKKVSLTGKHGGKFILYNRQGKISLAMGGMATVLVAAKKNGSFGAETFGAEYSKCDECGSMEQGKLANRCDWCEMDMCWDCANAHFEDVTVRGVCPDSLNGIIQDNQHISYQRKKAETFGAEELVCSRCGTKEGVKKYNSGYMGIMWTHCDDCRFGPVHDRNMKERESQRRALIEDTERRKEEDYDPFYAETFGAKGIDTFAEPLEHIGISKPYARLGVIAAGITALAFGVKKLRK